MKREVWFEKVAWSYIPCHWKGWSTLAGVVFLTLSIIALGRAAIAATGWQAAADLPFLAILPGLLLALRIAERHS